MCLFSIHQMHPLLVRHFFVNLVSLACIFLHNFNCQKSFLPESPLFFTVVRYKPLFPFFSVYLGVLWEPFWLAIWLEQQATQLLFFWEMNWKTYISVPHKIERIRNIVQILMHSLYFPFFFNYLYFFLYFCTFFFFSLLVFIFWFKCFNKNYTYRAS